MDRLRWKMSPRETGPRAFIAGSRGSTLHDGKTRYATVSELRDGGWCLVAGWESGLPYMNTCGTPSETEQEAKIAAMAYVKAQLATQAERERGE